MFADNETYFVHKFLVTLCLHLGAEHLTATAHH